MRKLAVAFFALTFSAPAAATFGQTAAAPGTLSELAVGNTTEVDYPGVPGHPHVTFKLKADKTFTAVFPGNVAGSGDYTADDRYICWITKIPAEPAGGANARCEVNTSARKSAAGTWTMTDSTGAEAVITITPGQ